MQQPKPISVSDQQFFLKEYPTGAIAYRAIRVPEGFGKILPNWTSYTDNKKTNGNKGQMVTIGGSSRGPNHAKRINGVIHYALNPPVQAPKEIFPDGKFKDSDQIIVMHFRVLSKHILTNGAPGAGVNEHMVLRPDINLASLTEFHEERMTAKDAKKKIGVA